MRALCVTMALLLAPAIAFAEPAVPSTLQDVDETQTIAQRDAMPTPCIAIVTGEATMYLSTQRMTAIAAAAPARIVSVEDAKKRLAADRAAALLDTLGGPRDEDGCQPPKTGLGGQAQYALLDEIRQGAVFVRTDRPRERIPALQVRYLSVQRRDPGCGSGTIHVMLPERATSELELSWWTAYGGACPAVSTPSA